MIPQYGERMNVHIKTWVAIFILIASGSMGAASQAATPVDFTGLVEDSIPAVVNIETRRFGERPQEATRRGNTPDEAPEDMPEFFRRFFGDPFGGGRRGEPDRRGGGSGFIIESDGLIVTNHHVIDEADEIIVRLADRREFEATLVGSDPQTDVAILRIDADDLPTLRLGDSDGLKPGEWVIAIGSPFQFEQSVTAGIVSAKGRSQGQQQYVPFIQSDVAINRGNSGGPLIRTDGTVVGINSWILSSGGGNIGLSFSIPIEVAQNSINQLLEFGRVSRGYMGVGIEVVTREKADALGLERPAGALVNRVEPDGAAAEAGIEVGDVIVSFNGRAVDVFSELPPLVGMVPPGESAQVEIFRWGDRQTLEVVVRQLDETEVLAARNDGTEIEPSNALGLVVEPITDEATRRQLGEPEGGVVVTDVESDAAYRQGVRPGLVVLMINNQTVADMDDFNAIVEGLESGRPVALLLHRPNGTTTFVAYTPEVEE